VTDPAIRLEGVSKAFKIYHRRHSTLKETLVRRRRGVYDLLHVLDDVSLDVPHGQSIGIVGRNGAGKSTMLKVMCGLMPPDAGSVTVWGRVSSLLELGAGFQGEYSGTENVFLYGALMGLSQKFISERFDDIVEFSGVGDYLDNPVKTYSSGMYLRLAFAVAVHVDPDVLLIDEVLAVGDQTFRQKCFERAQRLRAEGKTIVLVSHEMGAVRRFCDRAIWVHDGKIRADGDPTEITSMYLEWAEGAAPVTSSGTLHVDAPVSVGAIHLRDRAGREVNELATGSAARLEFEIQAHADHPQASVDVRWMSPDGTCVMANTSRLDGGPGLHHGTLRASCSLASLPFAAGQHRVEISVNDAATGRVLSGAHEPFLVQVLGPPSEGVTVVPVEWTWEGSRSQPAEAPQPAASA